MRRGDTIIEVVFSITIFSMVSIISIALMNSGVATTMASLEMTMARNEIDAQAEALRFIHNNYVAEYERSEEDQNYRDVWLRITGTRSDPGLTIAATDLLSVTGAGTCDAIYSAPALFGTNNPFIINTRRLAPGINESLNPATVVRTGSGVIIPTAVNPRVIYTSLAAGGDSDDGNLLRNATYDVVSRAEGIWITAVRGDLSPAGVPNYFDFYIRTCWIGPGRTTPTKLGTVIRLYNPANAIGGA
jgi:hypothetical protein